MSMPGTPPIVHVIALLLAGCVHSTHCVVSDAPETAGVFGIAIR